MMKNNSIEHDTYKSVMNNDDTICALATAAATSAIAVIRVSGPKSFDAVSSLFKRKNCDLNIEDIRPNRLYYGEIIVDNEVVDDVFVSFFKSPHSYTGEDSAEISCHGSSYIRNCILEALISKGIRFAEAGEYTKRAFLNGKLDLAQAEAVADLISSENRAAHRLAMNQMRGGFSDELRSLRSQLVEMTSLLELELDFSEEDVEFANRDELLALTDSVTERVTTLAKSFRLGNAIKNGVPVAIVGEPNTGKSTLLNTLLNDDRAIVSEIAGTTRDTIEETMTIDGILFRFIDTAGIRKTTEKIEKIGIERSLRKLMEADIVLGVLDITDDYEAILNAVELIVSRTDVTRQNVILLLNKSDMIPAVSEDLEKSLRKMLDERISLFPISARNGDGVQFLKESLVSSRIGKQSENDMLLVSNMRHFEALRCAGDSLKAVHDGLVGGVSSDFIAQDLRHALYHLGSITGEVTSDEVLGNIFGRFCIGK